MKAWRYRLKGWFSGFRLPVGAGPLRGYWLSAFSGTRFIRGTYDREQVESFLAYLKPGDVVYDIGAHVGYYSLAAARKLAGAGRVIAFEPLPLNLKLLRGHIASNRVANIEVIAACVADASGEAYFDAGRGTGRGRLSQAGGDAVPVVALDELVASGSIPPPNLIKMDVEGAELSALSGARRLLAQHRPVIMLSVHSAQLKQDCSKLLLELGYSLLRTAKTGQILAHYLPSS